MGLVTRNMVFLLFLILLMTAPAWATISGTSLTVSGDTACNGTSTTASITPTANSLVLACVTTEIGSGTAGTVTMSGNGLTWQEVDNQLLNGSLQRVTLLRALGASPSSGTATITVSADQANCTWSIAEFSGVDTTGTHGSGAVLQSNKSTSSGAVTSHTLPTLSAFSDANNIAVACFGNSTNNALTAGSGFTLLGGQQSCCGSRTVIETDATDTTADITVATGAVLGGMTLELKVPTAARGKMPPRYYNDVWPRLTFPVAYRGGYVAQ